MSEPILKNIRVIEASTGVAGPMAACRLGDLGADIVKVEWGDGDWMRAAPPFLPDKMSAAFFALNRGKRSIRADGQEAVIRRLVEKADVLITDQPADALEKLGIGDALESPCSWNEKLITVSITPWGGNGPLSEKPGSELCAQAAAGYTRYVGTAGQPAVRLGADVGGAGTAIFATQAVLAALIARRKSGRGQRVDLSLLNSLLAMKTVHLAAQTNPDAFEGPRVGGAYDPPERGWATADAPITFAFGGAVGAEGRPGWTQFVSAVGLDRLLEDSRFDKTGRQTTGLGPKARELKPEYETEFKKRPSAEVVGQVRKFGGFASAYMSHEALLREPQMAALKVVRDVPGGGGTVRTLSFPAAFSDSTTALNGHAPKLGEHTQDIRRELGLAR